MSDEGRAILEERLTRIEAELHIANQRVRELEGWRRRATSVFVLGIAVVAGLGVVVSQTGTARGGTSHLSSLTVEAPFLVEDASGRTLVRIGEDPTSGGGAAFFLDKSGFDAVQLGVPAAGGGELWVQAPGDKHSVVVTADNEDSSVSLNNSGEPVAELDAKAELLLGSSGKKHIAVAELSVLDGDGNLELDNAAGDTRVEAGTSKNDDGLVRVTGPRGRCLPGVGGIACMLTAR